jgi:hypothetical protein
MSFEFTIMSQESFARPPDDGVYVQGFYLKGARWNQIEEHLSDQMPRQLVDLMSIVFDDTNKSGRINVGKGDNDQIRMPCLQN